MKRLVLLVVAVFATGCASIPESTPVEIIDDNVAGAEEHTVGAPPPGLDPYSVVRQFVEAGIAHANSHEGARSYLTAEAARTWDDVAPIYVFEDRFDAAPAEQPEADSGTRRVALRTRQLGRVGQNGVFGLERRDVQFDLNVVQEDGEWRVSNPPPGLLMRETDFRSSFRVVDLSYVDATSNVLIKDRRWVLNRPPSALPGRVVNLLLGDPSKDLTGAVINELSGARLLSNVANAPDSVLTVDLSGVPQLNDTQRKLAAAQIVTTLGEVVGQPVRILADGEPLTPDRPVWHADDVPREFVPSVDVAPQYPGLVVTQGRITQVSSNRPVEVGVPNVVSAAQHIGGELFAVVTSDQPGQPRLWIGRPGQLRPVDLQAGTLSEPNWRRGRDEVWIVADGNRLVSVSTDPVPQVQDVEVTELTRHGTITQLRLSRDGVRVAAIVNNTLMLAAIVGTGERLAIRNARVLPASNPTQMIDVDFVGTDQVVIATASQDTPVYETSLDGQSWRPFGTSNLTLPITNLAAVAGRPVLVADQFGVWSANTATSVWQQVGFGTPAVPVYPG